jgi:hypothetical protein
MRRIYPSSVILGGAGGLTGFFLGYGRGASTMLGLFAVAAWIGLASLVKHYRQRQAERER